MLGGDTQKYLLGFLLPANTRHMLNFLKDPFRGVDEIGCGKKQHFQNSRNNNKTTRRAKFCLLSRSRRDKGVTDRSRTEHCLVLLLHVGSVGFEGAFSTCTGRPRRWLAAGLRRGTSALVEVVPQLGLDPRPTQLQLLVQQQRPLSTAHTSRAL